MTSRATGNGAMDFLSRKGTALIATLIILFFLTLLATAITGMVFSRLTDITLEVDTFKALCLAEAGMAKALYEMSTGIDEDENGIGNIDPTPMGEGVYRVSNNPEGQSLTSVGVVHGVRKVVFIKYG